MRLEVLGPYVDSSAYLVAGGATILLDCGPGTRRLLAERQLVGEIDAIVVSHMHVDHMIDAVLLATDRLLTEFYPALRQWRRTLLLVPRDDGERVLRAISDALPGDHWDRLIATYEIVGYGADDRFELDGLELTFASARHNVPCYATRVASESATVAYTADSGFCPELVRLADGADLLLCEATFCQESRTFLDRHMSGLDAGRLADEAEVGRLVLTHLPPDRSIVERNLADARSAYRGPVDLAEAAGAFDL